MERRSLQDRLYLSTIGSDAVEKARAYGLGLELAEFCTASNLDRDRAIYLPKAEKDMDGVDRFWFHAPFAELCPAAIDPKVRSVTAERYRQAIGTALELGIRRIVIHGGFIPMVYFPEWFVEQSVLFWREFLRSCPENVTIALENVMDPGPEMLVSIAEQVADPRLRLCLDVGHANASCSNTPPTDWIEPMAPWLCHTHIHNNEGAWDLHNDLGTGNIPMEQILDRLLELDVTFTLENMNCEKSVRWLADRGYLK